MIFYRQQIRQLRLPIARTSNSEDQVAPLPVNGGREIFIKSAFLLAETESGTL
jgi:hypothetical protein